MPDTQADQQNTQTLMPKTLEAFKLVAAGLEPREALQAVNCTKKISSQSVSVFKKKLKKYSLTSPSIVKSANNQIKRILAGEVREVPKQAVTKAGEVVDYTEVIAPSDTNILAAASMVYDRYEPVKGQSAGPTSNTYIDLSNYDVKVINSSSSPIAGTELDAQGIDIAKDKDIGK